MTRASILFVLCLAACDDGGETTVTVRVAPEPSRETPAAAAEPDVAEPVVAAEPAGPPPEVAQPYDEGADAAADIERALAAARRDHKRVLLMFGANWCEWCRRLEHVLRNDPQVSSALRDGFEIVHVSTGSRRSGTNAEIDERYGHPTQHGLPVFVVLDENGEPVMTQETGALEIGDRHDPAKVLEFLRRARG